MSKTVAIELDIDELRSIDAVARFLGYKNAGGVRVLVSRGLLTVAARGSRHKALFRRDDVSALAQLRAASCGSM